MSEPRKEAVVRAPFIFGVSGHRDLVASDLPELWKQLRRIFEHFREAYPHVSFELLSPLAEGADRVAAEVALDCGVNLCVPLPMAQTEYERDFTAAGSLGEFRRLLGAARSHFEVGDKPADQPPLSENNVRTQHYAAVGDFIARQSHVLILLWDGRDNRKVGGTAWVKKQREHWIQFSALNGTAPEVFGYVATIHVLTPRQPVDGMSQLPPRIEIVGDLPPVRMNQTDERSKL